MGQAIGALLPTAGAVMLSPTGIVVVILLLVTAWGRGNGLAYLLGWVLSVGAVGAAGLLMAGAFDPAAGGEPAAWVDLLLLVDRARHPLDELKEWLAAHNAAIMVVVLLLFGLKLIGEAIAGLSA